MTGAFARKKEVVAPPGGGPSPYSVASLQSDAAARILALQRSAGNRAVTQTLQRPYLRNTDEAGHPGSPIVQRQIKVTGSADTLHGLDIDAILKRPKTQKLAQLIDLCRSSVNTHLIFDTYIAPSNNCGITECSIIGKSGRTYNLDWIGPGQWRDLEHDGQIYIKIKMNSAFVRGRAEDVQTLLHEVIVHAAEYVPFIRRMRNARSNEIRGIWDGATELNGSLRPHTQHNRLGSSFHRTMSAEVDSMGRYLEAQGLAYDYLDEAHARDIQEHAGPLFEHPAQ